MKRFVVWVACLVLGAVGSSAAEFAPDRFQRLAYNHPGLVVDLGVGLYAWPLPMDHDDDGDIDLVLSSPDAPTKQLWLFENPGGESTMPVFKPGVALCRTKPNLQVSYVDGQPRILGPNVVYRDFKTQCLKSPEKLPLKTNLHSNVVRANQWKQVDYEGDGDLDLIVGVGDWTDYGWDDAYDDQGNWTNGPLRGFVYLVQNSGSDEKPEYEEPVKLEAGGAEIDVYGMPTPNLADFDGDGDLDLLCGEFVDKFTYFENVGTRSKPEYADGEFLTVDGDLLKVECCMFVPVAFDWDNDGHVDLIVGQEDGRVMFIRNSGEVSSGIPQFESPQYFRQQADEIKEGVLVTPCGVDWDNDGLEDLVCGNATGNIVFIKNLGGNPPRWAAPEPLEVDGQKFRVMAGMNGSIQGPCEEKWGYTVLNIADLNQDGLKDIVLNSIWGKVMWLENIGTATEPKVAAPQPIEIDWQGKPRSPAWNWWSPEGNEFVTQWRSSIQPIDLTGDGHDDLVALDEEGYLAMFERVADSKRPVYRPGKRIFHMKAIEPNVYDHHQRTIAFDVNGDGKNDLGRLNSDDELSYYATAIVDGNKETAPNKLVAHSDDPRYEDDDYLTALRLTAGWAGRAGRRKFVLTDWDQDGRIDLLVNSVNISYLRNVAEQPGEFVFQDMGPLNKHRLAGHTTCPTTVDWDGNGVPDLVAGAEDGFLYFLANPHPVHEPK